ncbi:MAG: CDP-alcohol phosphatidyltransferase family protein [Candidatus Omnitrophota bacterium]
MRRILLRNSANLIVFLRIFLVFLVLAFLSFNSFAYRVTGLAVLILAALLDWVDGYIARKLDVESQIGGLLDTLGDRITENLIMIFLAYRHLIPFAIGALFVARSFLADFIRGLNFKNDIGTFQINNSRIGAIFVSSVTSRISYLLCKMFLFVAAAIALILELPDLGRTENLLSVLKGCVYYGSFLVMGFSLLRFFLLIYDSRNVLRGYFLSGR